MTSKVAPRNSESDIKPSKETLTRHFGVESNLFKQATTDLAKAYRASRNSDAVADKRRRWQHLIQVAQGQQAGHDDDWLFVRHTYLTTLTALILQRHFGIDLETEAERNSDRLLDGSTLEQLSGIKDVIGDDIFLWTQEAGEVRHVQAIAQEVMKFGWTEPTDELTATLYENTITQEERKRLGEYYTPRWLAQAIVDEFVDDPSNSVSMDPSCGSGAFIECLVRAIASDDSLTPSQKLDRLQCNVIGVDTHPVAVALGKATWALNALKAITDARSGDDDLPPIIPPIHLGDSLQLRSNKEPLFRYGTDRSDMPAAAEGRIDVIVGNPPWMTYANSADVMREELMRLSQNTYGIWAGGKNAPNQDIATLFFARVADLYLRHGGKIGMVLPHSTLRAGHHVKWRKGSWGAYDRIDIDFGVKPPWDLDNLEPNTFFPMPSAVVFARLTGRNTDASAPLAPGEVEVWEGPTNTTQVKRNLAPLIHDDGAFLSPYHQFARRGVDLCDRRLYFITVLRKHAENDVYLTDPQLSDKDKKQYAVQRLHKSLVHGDNIFDACLGENIAPYYMLPPRKVAVPVNKKPMSLSMTGRGEIDASELDENMQRRWEAMCILWDEHKGQNDQMTLSQRLDYNGSLSHQLRWMRAPGARAIRIAYTTSGRPSAALVDDDRTILDTSVYQVTCRNSDEAHYLLAVINSDALADAVKPFCPTNWDRKVRTLHKHLWKLPIPVYDDGDALHRRLAQLGHAAADDARRLLGATPDITPRNARKMMRQLWQPTSDIAMHIEAATDELSLVH